jgi:hypothetical protein
MYQETGLPDAPMIVATGRAYESCSLMGTTGALTDAPIGVDYEDLSASTCQITEVTIDFFLYCQDGEFETDSYVYDIRWSNMSLCASFHLI